MPKTTPQQEKPPERSPDEAPKTVCPLAGERCAGESDAAVCAFNDYARMGAGRSLRLLTNTYRVQSEYEPRTEIPPIPAPPTMRLATICDWSLRFDWQERVGMYDARIEALKTQDAEAEFLSGIGLPHVRLRELKEMHAILKGDFMEVGQGPDGGEVLHNLWMPDVKSIGSGEMTERVDLEKYNSAIVNDRRALLDDAAKETGGRRPKDDSQALLNLLVAKVGVQNLPDEIIDRMVNGENPYVVIFDIINNFKVPVESTPAVRGFSLRGST